MDTIGGDWAGPSSFDNRERTADAGLSQAVSSGLSESAAIVTSALEVEAEEKTDLRTKHGLIGRTGPFDLEHQAGRAITLLHTLKHTLIMGGLLDGTW